MSDPTPSDTFEAMCRVANAKHKIRKSGGLFDAMMRKRDGSQIHVKTCSDCGVTGFHDVWSTFEDETKTEHQRCQNCGKHMTYR